MPRRTHTEGFCNLSYRVYIHEFCLQQIQELVECSSYTRSILALCTWRALDPCSRHSTWAGGDSGRMIPNNNTRQCESCPEKGMLCATEDNNPHHNHRSLIVVAYHSRPTGFIFSVIDPRDQQLGWFESGRQVEEEGWGLVLPSAIHSNLGGFSYYYYVLCFSEPSQSTVWSTVPCKKDVETVKWSHLEEEGRYFEWRSLRLKSQKSKMELGN